MAVLTMRRISVYGLKTQWKGVLELIQRRGVVEVIQEPPDSRFTADMDTKSDQNQFAAAQKVAQQALEILDKHCPVKKSPLAAFQGRRPISLEDYRAYLTRVTETGSAAHDIVGLARELEDCKADIVRLQAKLETLKPWLGLDISMRTRGTRETAAFIGTFPQERRVRKYSCSWLKSCRRFRR